MIARCHLKNLMLIVSALTAPLYCSSFSIFSNSPTSTASTATATTTTTALSMGLFGGKKEEEKPAGPTTVMNISALNIKPTPLRFFLQIYIVGDQNSKDNQSWLPQELEGDNQGLQIFYSDGTGMCQIEIDLENKNINIERHGATPSLQYMLQESVMLHGVLDELHQMAFGEGEEGDDLKEEERLLNLEEGVIDKCREILPARKA